MATPESTVQLIYKIITNPAVKNTKGFRLTNEHLPKHYQSAFYQKIANNSGIGLARVAGW
jgi:hypothetical protein